MDMSTNTMIFPLVSVAALQGEKKEDPEPRRSLAEGFSAAGREKIHEWGDEGTIEYSHKFPLVALSPCALALQCSPVASNFRYCYVPAPPDPREALLSIPVGVGGGEEALLETPRERL